VLHGARRATEEAVAHHIEVFGERLQSYPDWPEIEDLPACPACVVPPTDRPNT
jgi:glutathione-regulated potassium-efflux system ancillary protein KefF